MCAELWPRKDAEDSWTGIALWKGRGRCTRSENMNQSITADVSEDCEYEGAIFKPMDHVKHCDCNRLLAENASSLLP